MQTTTTTSKATKKMNDLRAGDKVRGITGYEEFAGVATVTAGRERVGAQGTWYVRFADRNGKCFMVTGSKDVRTALLAR